MARVVPEDAKRLTFAEYLEIEEPAETRHEFVDGFMFAMAGGTTGHNTISGNIYSAARNASRGSNCRIFIADVKVKTPQEKGYYPDVFAICDEDEEDQAETRFKRRPCLIVEVLSESTEAIDRGEKLLQYQTIPSLQTYVLVSQDQKLVETYQRLPDGAWRYEKLEGPSSLRLSCIALTMTLEEVYEDVNFDTAARFNP